MLHETKSIGTLTLYIKKTAPLHVKYALCEFATEKNKYTLSNYTSNKRGIGKRLNCRLCGYVMCHMREFKSISSNSVCRLLIDSNLRPILYL